MKNMDNVGATSQSDTEQTVERFKTSSRTRNSMTFQETVATFAHTVRNQMLSWKTTNPEAADSAFNVIKGNPNHDPEKRLLQLTWDALEKKQSSSGSSRQWSLPPRPANVSHEHQLPPQGWLRASESHLDDCEKLMLIMQREEDAMTFSGNQQSSTSSLSTSMTVSRKPNTKSHSRP